MRSEKLATVTLSKDGIPDAPKCLGESIDTDLLDVFKALKSRIISSRCVSEPGIILVDQKTGENFTPKTTTFLREAFSKYVGD